MNVALPEQKHAIGYPLSQVKGILTPEEFRIFEQWMIGQQSTFDGEPIIYRYEMERFMFYKSKGMLATNWD